MPYQGPKGQKKVHIWIEENEDKRNAACEVCQHKSTKDDYLVICKGCNVATHCSCYGRELIPPKGRDKNWVERNPDSQWHC